MRTVYTGGTFDLPHEGHLHFLWQCRKIAGEDGKVVVALNSDRFVTQYKGEAPWMNYDERAEALRANPYVDEVIENDSQDSKPNILKVQPDFLVIGSDWAQKDYYKQMSFTQEWLDDQGILLIYVPYFEGISTTEIKKKFRGFQ